MASFSVHSKGNSHIRSTFERFREGHSEEFVVFKLFVDEDEILVFLRPENVQELKNSLTETVSQV